MRPNSIILFERLYLGSLALGVVNMAMSFNQSVAQFQANPDIAKLGWGGGAVLAIFLLGIGVSLLLWYLIARRGSSIAKWFMIAFTAIGLLSLPGAFSMQSGSQLAFAVVTNLLQLAAAFMLFRPDTKAWFAGHGSDPIE